MSNLKINHECIPCILNKYFKTIPDGISEEEKLSYIKGILKIISSCDNTVSAPEIIYFITEYKNSLFGFSDDFAEIKKYFNKLMLSNETFYSEHIKGSENPLKTSLKFAMLGNYIDFGALDKVEDSKLLEIPNDAAKLDIDKKEYQNLKTELKSAESLVYLTDNCGEIAMDKLFIKEIKSSFPKLNITVIVKGGPVLNDATMDDALTVGLDKVTDIIDSGCSIAGTPLSRISNKAKALIDNADIIISKGQANFETLNGCKKNIYYLFLCKCSLYSRRFNVPQFTGLLLNEKRIKDI